VRGGGRGCRTESDRTNREIRRIVRNQNRRVRQEEGGECLPKWFSRPSGQAGVGSNPLRQEREAGNRNPPVGIEAWATDGPWVAVGGPPARGRGVPGSCGSPRGSRLPPRRAFLSDTERPCLEPLSCPVPPVFKRHFKIPDQVIATNRRHLHGVKDGCQTTMLRQSGAIDPERRGYSQSINPDVAKKSEGKRWRVRHMWSNGAFSGPSRIPHTVRSWECEYGRR